MPLAFPATELHLGSITLCLESLKARNTVHSANPMTRCQKLSRHNIPDFLKLLDSPSSKRTSEKEASDGAFFCSSFKLCAICYTGKQERIFRCSYKLAIGCPGAGVAYSGFYRNVCVYMRSHTHTQFFLTLSTQITFK